MVNLSQLVPNQTILFMSGKTACEQQRRFNFYALVTSIEGGKFFIGRSEKGSVPSSAFVFEEIRIVDEKKEPESEDLAKIIAFRETFK